MRFKTRKMADELNRMDNLEFSPILSSNKTGRRSLPVDYNHRNNEWSNETYRDPRLQASSPNILSKRFNINSNNLGLFNNKKTTFGTPSYPSPLDRIRTGRLDRAGQFGLNNGAEASFEVNQSFPKIKKSKLFLEDTMVKPKGNAKRQHGGGNGLNDVSFVSGHSRGSFSASSDHLNQSMGENWSFYNYLGGGQTEMVFPSTVRNPNKAICTINAKTSEILIANDMACELFGYETDHLIGQKLKDLIKLKPKDQATIMESHLEEKTGEVVSISGKVVDAVDSNGLVLPISLWVRKLEHLKEHRCLVVMEPVERRVALVTFNSQGTVLSCDHQLAYLYGYMEPDDVEGLEMKNLIPSFKLPEKSLTKDVRKQRATGRTRDGASFPLSIFVKLATEVEDDPRNIPPGANIRGDKYEDIYLGIIWVFSSISGLITFLPDGTIHNINENFSLMLFGYSSTDLVGKDISTVIPEFYDILKLDESVSLSDVNLRNEKDDMFVELPDCRKKVYGENDSSDDQGIGSSITSSHYHGTRLDVHHDGLSVLIPGVTSTPNKPVHTDSGLRKSLIEHDNQDIPSSDQVIDPVVTKLNLLTTSEDEEEVLPAIVHTDALSPCSHGNHSNVSVSSTDTIPTAREVIQTEAKVTNVNRADEKCDRLSDCAVKCTCDSNKGDVQYTTKPENVTDGAGLEYNNLDLSSTQELLAARIGAIDLDSSISSQDSSVVSDQLNGYSLGVVADISNGAQSSSAVVKETSVGGFQSDRELPPRSVDYIPSCSPKVHNDSSSSEDYSADLEHRLLQELISPLKDSPAVNLCQDKGDNSPHLIAEEHSASYNKFSSFTSDICESEYSDNISGGKSDISNLKSDISNVDQNKDKHSHYASSDSQGSSLQSSKSETLFPEGTFSGECKHRDDSRLGIVFQIKRIEMEDGSFMYSMWVTRDPEEVTEHGRSFGNLTLASSFNSTMDKSGLGHSLGEALIDRATSDSKIMDNIPCEDREMEERRNTDNHQLDTLSPGSGLYDLHYETLNSIGKGAFGFVKLGKRKFDDQEVVVKFIKRLKVLSECWITDDIHGKIPLEVSLLTKLRHPNVVKVLDVFENDVYIQMVMEKHGSGMDLFEFIDRSPLLDEPLASYIFRQMTSAVSYLHSNNILHRDIKDENVILNEHFHIKLIDFGAAAYMQPGKLFGTFCGTLEYCSPEVLQGNKYKGPELEMWSMGVTLYTLIFGENPFFDVDEIIQCVLKPPFSVSRSLMFLLMSLLHPNPVLRMSVTDCERDPWVNQPINIEEYKWSEVLPNSEFHGNTASDNRMDSPEQKPHKFSQRQNDFIKPDYHSTPNKSDYNSYPGERLYIERDAGCIPYH